MPWTAEQLDAIEASGNLIVSAAAGAGKTAVLTERIVRRVLEGTDVDNLLVLTFTRAAAAEMKARIAKRLAALAEAEGDPARAATLFAQSRAVGGAYISTVHAFCARVLRRHAHALGVAPESRVADETEAAVLVEEVKDRLLTARCEEENPDWRRLLSAFGGEDAAWNAVADTVRFLDAEPDGLAFLNEAVGRYGSDAGADEMLSAVVDECKEELTLALDALGIAKRALPPDLEKAHGVLDDALLRGRGLLLAAGYDAYRQGLLDMEYGRLTFPRDTDEAAKAPVRDARDALKALVKAQQKLFARPRAGECETMREAGVILFALSNVARAYMAAYADAKRQKNVFDFSDLEHLALAALRQPDIGREYREKFQCIAIDEYQDSNRVQEAIVDAVRREDNVFLVGDVKQSIYRFRQAEPALFIQKLTRYTGSAGRRIDLNRNFRSSARVLDAVNDTFSAVMREASAALAYDARARLYYGGAHEDGGAELHMISRETDGLDESLEAAADAEVEARLAADRIREIMRTEQILDAATGRTRPVAYSDIAILLRSTTHAQRIAETLSQCGVPCYAQLNGGYFDAVEVQVFLNLLSVIDNRRQDVPLISVLLSCVGDFSAEELSGIRMRHRAGTFFDAFEAEAKQEDGKARAFLATLARWREESLLVSTEALIGKLLDETGFLLVMGAGYGGKQRQANLQALLSKARALEASGGSGVSAFLRHMNLARSNASIGAAQTAGADVVRILTIHKSKGLEFPVVFALQLGARFNLRGDNDALSLHNARGVGLRFLENGERVLHDTAVRQSIVRRARREQLAEEMRVLYVAMTRAINRLVLVGCARNAEEKLARAKVDPAPYETLLAGSPLDWLMMGRRSALPVTIHDRARWLAPRQAEKDVSLPPADPALVAALETRFAWTYPFAASVALPSKASVSRVARADAALPLMASEGETLGTLSARLPDFNEPAFLRRGKPTPAFIGTATHAALSHLPTDTPLSSDALPGYLASLVERKLLTREQADCVPVATLDWFIGTALYARMTKSPRVERELSFAYAVDAKRLFATEANERVLLQGVIDCCFTEAGGWTLIDYKTDRIPIGETPEGIAHRHAAQLSLYSDALSALTGMPVRERYVVLLTAGAAVAL